MDYINKANALIKDLKVNTISLIDENGYSSNKDGIFNLYLYTDNKQDLFIFSNILNLKKESFDYTNTIIKKALSLNLINSLDVNYKIALGGDNIYLIHNLNLDTLDTNTLDKSISIFKDNIENVLKALEVDEIVSNDDNASLSVSEMTHAIWG